MKKQNRIAEIHVMYRVLSARHHRCVHQIRFFPRLSRIKAYYSRGKATTTPAQSLCNARTVWYLTQGQMPYLRPGRHRRRMQLIRPAQNKFLLQCRRGGRGVHRTLFGRLTEVREGGDKARAEGEYKAVCCTPRLLDHWPRVLERNEYLLLFLPVQRQPLFTG